MKLEELFESLIASQLDEAKFINIADAWGMELVRDVDRHGFPALMAPSTFLRLALPLDKIERIVDQLEPSEDWVINKIRDPLVRQTLARSPKQVRTIAQHMAMGGEKETQGAVATPFLEVECPSEWTRIISGGQEFKDPGRDNTIQLQTPVARVKSHDGRHRMLAVQALEGDRPVPIHIYIKFAGTTPDGDILRVADLDNYELAAVYHNIRLRLYTEREKSLAAGPLFELNADALPARTASGEKILPQEIQADIIKLFSQGYQPSAISIRLHISEKDVNRFLRRQSNYSELQRQNQLELLKLLRRQQ